MSDHDEEFILRFMVGYLSQGWATEIETEASGHGDHYYLRREDLLSEARLEALDELKKGKANFRRAEISSWIWSASDEALSIIESVLEGNCSPVYIEDDLEMVTVTLGKATDSA